jgi:organic hydroperoxide reductase OsmC/OhrA
MVATSSATSPSSRSTPSRKLAMWTDDQGLDGHGYSVESVHLIVHADLPGITDEQFEQLADEARRLCAISKILRVPITLGATLVTVTITTSAQHAPRESH